MIATKTKWPPHWIYYASIAYISAKTRSSALMKAYSWCTNDGNASWPVNGRQGSRQGTNQASGKSRVFLLPIPLLIILAKTFIPRKLIHRSRYCSINNTNQLRLLVSMCFCVKKNQQEDKSVRKTTVYGLKLVCSYFRPNHYTTRMPGQRHFKLPCSNHVTMGITYAYMRISYIVEINLV